MQPPRKPARFLIYGIVSILALLLTTLVIAEVIIRAVNPPPKVQVIRPQQIEVSRTSGVITWIQEFDRMNLSCPRYYPEAEIIVFSGDSIFFGSGVGKHSVFTYHLQQRLDDENGVGRWCVVNLSQPGFSFEQKKALLDAFLQGHRVKHVFWEVWASEANKYRMFGDSIYDFANTDAADGRLPDVIPGPRPLKEFLFKHSRLFEYFSLTMLPGIDFSQSWMRQTYVPMLTALKGQMDSVGTGLTMIVATQLNRPFSDLMKPEVGDRKVMLVLKEYPSLEVHYLVERLAAMGADVDKISYDKSCHFNEEGHLYLTQIIYDILAAKIKRDTASVD